MDGAMLLQAIFTVSIYIVIFGWFFKYNKNWFLKLSIIYIGIFIAYMLFFDLELAKIPVLTGNPIFWYITSAFSFGLIISIFVGFGNALQQGSVIAGILMIIFGIALCCTVVGIPFGIACLFKSGSRSIVKSVDKHSKS